MRRSASSSLGRWPGRPPTGSRRGRDKRCARSDRHRLIGAAMEPMTDDADTTPATPDPDDHVARLQAQIDATKARRAGYRAKAAETVARGGPARPTDEELGIIKTDDTAGKIAADA